MIFFKKKVECVNCKQKFKPSRVVSYGDKYFCSQSCMCDYFVSISTKELLELDKKDKEINPRIHNIRRK